MQENPQEAPLVAGSVLKPPEARLLVLMKLEDSVYVGGSNCGDFFQQGRKEAATAYPGLQIGYRHLSMYVLVLYVCAYYYIYWGWTFAACARLTSRLE